MFVRHDRGSGIVGTGLSWSQGGFLGVRTKYVVVPLNSLQISVRTQIAPGTTRDALKALPEFRYDA